MQADAPRPGGSAPAPRSRARSRGRYWMCRGWRRSSARVRTVRDVPGCVRIAGRGCFSPGGGVGRRDTPSCAAGCSGSGPSAPYLLDLRELCIQQRHRRTGARADGGARRVPRALSGRSRLDRDARIVGRRCAASACGVPGRLDAVGVAARVGVHRIPVAAHRILADRQPRVGMAASDRGARSRSPCRLRGRRTRLCAAASRPARVRIARRRGGAVVGGRCGRAHRLGAAGRYTG